MQVLSTYRYIHYCLLAVGILLVSACGEGKNSQNETLPPPQYPFNNKNETVVDTLWGERLKDPYSWLEKLNEQKVLNWAKKQNQVTFDFINSIPQRIKVLESLEKLSVSKEYKKGRREGNFYFYTVTEEVPDREIIYYADVKTQTEKLLVNPQEFSGNESARFSSFSVSKDNTLVAFSLQDPVSRREKIFIKDLTTNRFRAEIIPASYNTTIAWDDEGGFFYNRPFRPENGRNTILNAVFYHVAGTHYTKDIPVFINSAFPEQTNEVHITSDGRYAIIQSQNRLNQTQINFADLNAPPPTPFRLLSDQLGKAAMVIDNLGDKFIVLTKTGAPAGRVVLIDPKKPEPENWQTLIRETQDNIQRVSSLKGKFYVRSSFNMTGKITAYDSSGNPLSSVELPGMGIVDGFYAKPYYDDVLYSYQAFNYPLTLFRYNPEKNKSEIFKQTEQRINPDDYTIKKEFCLTEEGVGIPLLIFHKKDLVQNGKNPLMFCFSGGMDDSYLPGYSLGRFPFIDNGGIFVLAAVRGSNEGNENWYLEGAGSNRKQAVEDVSDCLDYLVSEKYTSDGNIALLTKHAGSYAAIETVIQHPGKIKLVAIFQGIFDLLQYGSYDGCNACIAREFGNPRNDMETFRELKNKSPLLRAYETRNWPAIYLEHKIIDPIVSPVHSFKFIAALQDNDKGGAPKLLRTDNECCVENRRQELFSMSERWALALYLMGMQAN